MDRPAAADHRLTRRQALGLGAAAVASTLAPGLMAAPAGATAALPTPARQATDALRPQIRPRSDWAGDLPVTGELLVEEDVRFLLVHHTASTNAYDPDGVIDQIRGFYEFHTGPEKGWPDVAYNFFVDRFGGIWEARAGSLDGPVRGDATGGSQGFAMLCSLIGDFHAEPVTEPQLASLNQLLAWLGEIYNIDTSPGATVDFVSRGSSRWPEGDTVRAATISGHRDMSTTTCPGDFAYPLLAEQIPAEVTQRRVAAGGGVTTTTAPTTPTTTTETAAISTTTTEATADRSATAETATEEAAASTETPTTADGAPGASDDDGYPIPPILAAGVAVLGVAATTLAVAKNHTADED